MKIDQESLTEKLGGYTSDHGWQSAMFQLIAPENNKVTLQLTGVTWNMLNKCHDKQHCISEIKYANNPFDYCEDDDEYRARKLQQLQHITYYLMPERDFIFLQEVDWIYNDELKKIFLKHIHEMNWGVVTTLATFDIYTRQKPLVILYDTSVLTYLDESRGVLPVVKPYGKIYTGFEALFKYKPTGQCVSLTNFHFDYEHVSYAQDMDDLLIGNIRRDISTFAGGDTNLLQDEQHYSFIGNWSYPTNFYCENGALTTTYTTRGGKEYTRRVDGFFACPTLKTYLKIIENEGLYFVITDDSLTVKVSVPGNMVYQSERGHPWKRYRRQYIEAKSALENFLLEQCKSFDKAQQQQALTMVSSCKRLTDVKRFVADIKETVNSCKQNKITYEILGRFSWLRNPQCKEALNAAFDEDNNPCLTMNKSLTI